MPQKQQRAALTGPSLAQHDVPDVPYDHETVVIEGLVGEGGQGDFVSRAPGWFIHFLTFAGWRVLGGPLATEPLLVLCPLPTSVEDPWRDRREFRGIEAYSVERFQVLLSKDRRRAILERELPRGPVDPELMELADSLQKPVVVSSSRLGDFVLDRTMDWFEGRADWNGKPVGITVERGDDGSLDNAIRIAETLFAAQAEWKQRVDDFAVAQLLGLKNDGWLAEDEAEVTVDEFKSRMTLTSIGVDPEGRIEFWHDDGDLFWGHSILVRATLERGPFNVDTPG